MTHPSLGISSHLWKQLHTKSFEEPDEWEQPVADEQAPGHMCL